MSCAGSSGGRVPEDQPVAECGGHSSGGEDAQGGLVQGFVPCVVVVAMLGAPASFSGFPRPWGSTVVRVCQMA